ncbi:cystine/glutamate transporter-like isoform X5 [Petromyzon marinus]|uniref:cystine/glutamate transporter-like isoform X5 n=1 Tax=Petromyzon marinus TaxID=7757 RepID=UPI003F7240F8
MKPQQHAEATPVMLDRTIGFLYGIFMQVGMIIGSGIFISPSGVLRHAGSVGWALMVWLACGFLSLLGALSYAELGTTIRQSGSHYIYLRETLGTLPAFLFLWVEFIIVRPSVMAVVFLSMGQYSLEALYSPCAVPRIAVKLLAMVSICESSAFVVWVNTWSSTLSLRVQSCLSVSKLAALASIIGVGIAHVARASRLPRRADRIFRERLRHRRQPPGRSAAGVLLGDVRLFGVGFPELCHGGGEAPRTHDSGGDLRLAGHRDRRLPPRQRRLLRRAHPVADPRLRCRGPDIRRKHPGQCVLDHRASLRGPVLPRRQHGLVLYITQGVHRAGCSPCRVFMVASRQHHWPSIFRMIHVRRRTPCPAMLLLLPLLLCLMWLGDVHALINYCSGPQWFFVGLVSLGLVRQRVRRPDLPRPFKVPLAVPVLFSCCCLGIVACSVYSSPANLGMGALITLSGVPVYAACLTARGRRAWPGCVQRHAEWITQELQLLMEVVPQEETNY